MERKSVGKRLTQEVVESRFQTIGLKLLDTYCHGRKPVKVRCFCGNEFITKPENVFSGHTSSCGCTTWSRLSAQFIKKLTGQKFGKLLVLDDFIKKQRFSKGRPCGHRIYWKCLCDCGREKYVESSGLSYGNSTSCGSCGTWRNGKQTSFPVIDLEEKLTKEYFWVEHNINLWKKMNVDLYLPLFRLVIEYDEWLYHQNKQDKDAVKSAELIEKGYSVIRIKSNGYQNVVYSDVISSIESCVEHSIAYQDIVYKGWGDPSIKPWFGKNKK